MQKLTNDGIAGPPRVLRATTTLRQMVGESTFDGELVQYAAGTGVDRVDYATTSDARLMHVRFPHEAFITAAQPKGFVPFTIPLDLPEHWKVNGVEGTYGGIFVNFGAAETDIYAPRRNSIIGRLRTKLFISVFGELNGSSSHEGVLPRGRLQLRKEAFQKAARKLLRMIYHSDASENHGKDFDYKVAITVAEAIMNSVEVPAGRPRKGIPDWTVFDKARREILRRSAGDVSLNDMCEVAGASAPKVIRSFRAISNTTPVHFERMRRLSLAQFELAENDEVLTVKQAALKAGFSEFGRFSDLYRRTYGRLPSEELERNSKSKLQHALE